MTANSLQFNKFEIKSNVDGKTVDLRAGTSILQYRESVFMPHVEITAFINDTGNTVPADDGSGAGVALLDAGFGQSTETILFNMEDEKGNKINLTKENDLRVDKIVGGYQSFKNENYMLTAVSKEAYDNTLIDNRCRNLYSGKMSDIARTVVKENLKSPKWQSMNTDETLDDYNGFAPLDDDKKLMSPFDFLLYLQQLSIPNIQTSKGKTAKGNTAGYLFFQTATGYQFRSLDKLFDPTGKTIMRYIENSKADDDIAPGFDGKILWSNMTRSVSGLDQFTNGAYSTALETFNPVTKDYTTTALSSKGKGNGIMPGKNIPIFNPDFCDADGNPLITRLRKTSQTAGQTRVGLDSIEEQVEKTDLINYNVEDIFEQTHQNYFQKMNMTAEIVVECDLSLNAGDLIFCEFPEPSTKPTQVGSNKRKSGIYMIADLCHHGDVGNSFTGLHLVRGSFGV